MKNKRVLLLTILICSSSVLSHPVLADAINLNGFFDMIYVVSDGTSTGPSSTESRFDISAEIDVIMPVNNNIATRFDIDLNPNGGGFGGGSSGDSGKLEQAYFGWQSPQGISVKGGVFNNPVGWEAEDAPDLYQISHGQIYDILNNETSIYGNNLAGVLVSALVGPVKLTGAFVNDLGNVREENSLALVANYRQISNLDIEIGILTQDGSAETIIDINGTYKISPLTIGAEILFAGKIYDFAIASSATYQVNGQLGITARFDSVSYDIAGVDDTRSFTIAASYAFLKNLTANVEVRLNDDDSGVLIGDGDVIQLEAIVTFG